MGVLNRATRGGVGAAIAGLMLAVLAMSAGWASGAVYDGRAPRGCGAVCSSSVSAAEAGADPTAGLLAVPTPQPTEPAGFPFVSARSISIIEGSCGAQIYGRNPHLRLPPASLTKLMTAAVAVDHASVDKMITTNVDSAKLYQDTGSTIMGLKPGMELSLLDLLYGLLLPSGNDAAIAIAEGIGGTQDKFVALMNEKVQSLALTDTHFTNAHGLYDKDLYSSAYDMARLARYVMQNDTLRTIVSTTSWQPKWDGPPVWNGNRLITDYKGADGVKIGYTEQSAQTIVGSATRGGRRIIVSLMRSQDRYTDAERLLDWAFAQPSACP
ncbi:MAG TPA: D-alanyl-D-alanine carboxypeptidase family protein [Dehalococcoidia bacterium]|nr:D-alanyl-D-alanine carboxypeptidase family protein [Dehalococcoidia bacterium]